MRTTLPSKRPSTARPVVVFRGSGGQAPWGPAELLILMHGDSGWLSDCLIIRAGLSGLLMYYCMGTLAVYLTIYNLFRSSFRHEDVTPRGRVNPPLKLRLG
jgi:hypothetical protein